MSDWTDELKAELKRRWSRGESAGEIAATMPGGFSRSAVIGAVKRMNLDGRKTTKSRPGARRSKPANSVDWDERRRVILDVQAHGGTYHDAALRFGVSPDTARQDAKRLGIPFAPRVPVPHRRSGYARPPSDRKSIKGVRQAPMRLAAAPEIAAYEAERRANGAIPFLDAPMRGRCKKFLGDDTGPYAMTCGARVEAGSWCQVHLAIVSEPVPDRQHIHASRR